MEKTNVSYSVIKKLIEENVLSEVSSVDLEILPKLIPKKLNLNKDQLSAAKSITNSIYNKSFERFLIDGVTGSGKTEVYFEAIEEALKEIMDTIKWRHQSIKNMIEWRKFTSGV